MNIIIVDDDNLVCTSLKIILEMTGEVTVNGIGHDGADAISLYKQFTPDIVLIDIQMKQINGIEAAKEILKMNDQAKILFLTTFSDDEYIVKALQIGVKGYLLKQDYDSILPALKAVESGQTVFGGEIMNKLPNLMGEKKVFDYKTYDITEKELPIIELVADGYSNKEIAEELYLSEGTVRNYLSEILNKLELRDRTQLAVFYYKNK